jgi:hypothetical protein
MELRSELSSRVSWHNILRVLHHWVPSLLREPEAQILYAARSIINVKAREADSGDVSRCTFRPALAVTVSSVCCDGQIPTATDHIYIYIYIYILQLTEYARTFPRKQLLIRNVVTSTDHV